MTPTRSNLMAAQKTLDFARERYDILDKKREVLLTELIHVHLAACSGRWSGHCLPMPIAR